MKDYIGVILYKYYLGIDAYRIPIKNENGGQRMFEFNSISELRIYNSENALGHLKYNWGYYPLL